MIISVSSIIVLVVDGGNHFQELVFGFVSMSVYNSVLLQYCTANKY